MRQLRGGIDEGKNPGVGRRARTTARLPRRVAAIALTTGAGAVHFAFENRFCGGRSDRRSVVGRRFHHVCRSTVDGGLGDTAVFAAILDLAPAISHSEECRSGVCGYEPDEPDITADFAEFIAADAGRHTEPEPASELAAPTSVLLTKIKLSRWSTVAGTLPTS